MGNFTTIVIDFETTGLSPNMGDRTIEVGAVLISRNTIIDRFQSLMNPGMKVSSFIEEYTGITNKMLEKAPPNNEVIKKLSNFIQNQNLVAHNASFDSKFLDSELKRLSQTRLNEFACTMLSARRIYQDAPNHKLETLVHYKKIKTEGVHHRALADAEMTAHLWMQMISDIKAKYHIKQIPFSFMQQLGRVPKKNANDFLINFHKQLSNHVL